MGVASGDVWKDTGAKVLHLAPNIQIQNPHTTVAHEAVVGKIRALVDMQASIAVADSPAPGGQITGSWLAKGGQFVFRTQYGLLDAFSWIAGHDYDSLAAGTITAQLADGTELRVCGYRDLVAMKRRAGRPRDEEDLNHLAALNPDR